MPRYVCYIYVYTHIQRIDACLIPGLGRSPGGRNGNPLQYSWLENPMDRGAWQAMVHRVTKSWTQLSNSEATTTVGFLCAECPQLLCHVPLCDPMDCSLPGSSVHRILQARIPEGVAMPSFRGSSQPRDRTRVSCVSCIAGRFFTRWATREALWQYWIYLFPNNYF